MRWRRSRRFDAPSSPAPPPGTPPPQAFLTFFGSLRCGRFHGHTLSQTYAERRGVEIVWEMDVPGHSSAAVKALPELFGFPSAPSVGIVNFVDATVVARLQTLFDEIDAVFNSSFVVRPR